MAISTLYICYFGVREPLVQTQVLPYLPQLALAGIKANLLTFEPQLQVQWSSDELADQRTQLMNNRINCFSLYYRSFWRSVSRKGRIVVALMTHNNSCLNYLVAINPSVFFT